MRNPILVTLNFNQELLMGQLSLSHAGIDFFERHMAQLTPRSVEDGSGLALGLSVFIQGHKRELAAVSILPTPAEPKKPVDDICVVRIPSPYNHIWAPGTYRSCFGFNAKVNGRNGLIEDITVGPDGSGAEFRIVDLRD